MISLAAVCEDQADFQFVSCLVDRLLTESFDWIDDSVLNNYREWFYQGSDNNLFFKWASIKRLCRQQNIKFHGHFDGVPAFPDARTGLKALRLIERLAGGAINVILLIRDQDDEPTRYDGLHQAKTECVKAAFNVSIVIGLAIIERESWMLSGYIAQGMSEAELIASLRRDLGFDPTAAPQLLTAGKDDTAVKSPKRVLKVLTNGDFDREQQCIALTPIEVLKTRGQSNGLTELLVDFETTILPLFK